MARESGFDRKGLRAKEYQEGAESKGGVEGLRARQRYGNREVGNKRERSRNLEGRA